MKLGQGQQILNVQGLFRVRNLTKIPSEEWSKILQQLLERRRRVELSVHYSARQNGFEEQVVRQQEQGGGGVDGHACGGGGGPRFRQRPTHQPSLPVSGVKI